VIGLVGLTLWRRVVAANITETASTTSPASASTPTASSAKAVACDIASVVTRELISAVNYIISSATASGVASEAASGSAPEVVPSLASSCDIAVDALLRDVVQDQPNRTVMLPLYRSEHSSGPFAPSLTPSCKQDSSCCKHWRARS